MVFSLAVGKDHTKRCDAGVSVLKCGPAGYTDPAPIAEDFKLILAENLDNRVLKYLSAGQRLDYLIPLLTKPLLVEKGLADRTLRCRFCAALYHFFFQDKIRKNQGLRSFVEWCSLARQRALYFNLPAKFKAIPASLFAWTVQSASIQTTASSQPVRADPVTQKVDGTIQGIGKRASQSLQPHNKANVSQPKADAQGQPSNRGRAGQGSSSNP